MTEHTSHLPRTPSWIDLGSPDTAASAAFYGGRLGWTAEIDPRPEAGGYGNFTLRGKRVVELSGSILMPPADMDFGRGAVAADPHGTVIGIGVMSAATQATAPA